MQYEIWVEDGVALPPGWKYVPGGPVDHDETSSWNLASGRTPWPDCWPRSKIHLAVLYPTDCLLLAQREHYCNNNCVYYHDQQTWDHDQGCYYNIK